MRDKTSRTDTHDKSDSKKDPASCTQQAGDSWQEHFLRTLAKTANVRYSCQMAKVNRKIAYEKRNADETFAQRWEGALEDACDLLEEEARRQAMKGSDALLISMLKPYRPAKCAERPSGQVTGTLYTVNGKTLEERMKEVAEVWQAVQAGFRGEPEV